MSLHDVRISFWPLLLKKEIDTKGNEIDHEIRHHIVKVVCRSAIAAVPRGSTPILMM